MSESAVERPAFGISRVLVGAVVAIVGHALTFAAGFVAARLVEPSQGGGFEDIAAVVAVFLGGQALLALACIIASLVLLVRGRQDVAVGLLGAWAAGVAAVAVFVAS